MDSVLFVDRLGVRRIWQVGGAPRAVAAFEQFRSLVLAAIEVADPADVREGGIESDSAIVRFASVSAALDVARQLFCRIFDSPVNNDTKSVWVRGCVVPAGALQPLRSEIDGQSTLDTVKCLVYSDCALNAIAVEKSGYKGMRLLVHNELINDDVREQTRVALGNRFLIPLKKLDHSPYPQAVEQNFSDLMWMACSDQTEWERRQILMTTKLRLAASDSDEFLQAAATQVLFHECAAIRHSIRSREDR